MKDFNFNPKLFLSFKFIWRNVRAFLKTQKQIRLKITTLCFLIQQLHEMVMSIHGRFELNA
jgi:hypothetical protein